jgi:hypothetical protein
MDEKGLFLVNRFLSLTLLHSKLLGFYDVIEKHGFNLVNQVLTVCLAAEFIMRKII